MKLLQKHELEESHPVVGIDEVGRGCLAGPATVASVILPYHFNSELIRDSKKLSEKQRETAYQLIIDNAIDYSITFIEVEEIEKYNILKSVIFGMHKSIGNLKITPYHILVDGNQFIPYDNISHTCVVKGDNTYQSIAAASILAKVTRDNFMKELHKQYPVYGWEKNKGYGTPDHVKSIRENGITSHHRKSFLKNLLDS